MKRTGKIITTVTVPMSPRPITIVLTQLSQIASGRNVIGSAEESATKANTPRAVAPNSVNVVADESNGRVFVTDHRFGPEVERVLCFDEATGKLLWVHSYPCDYKDMEYGNGPRASPTVHALPTATHWRRAARTRP